MDTQKYANLHTTLMVNPLIDSTETLTTVALMVYGIYTITNKLRAQGASRGEVAFDALAQAVKEGARGHRAASKVLCKRWQTGPTASTELPRPPLTPFREQITKLRRLSSENCRAVRAKK